MSKIFDPLKMPLHGVQLIEASAGTGKTYSIATLYILLLLKKRLPVDRILVVTFTEAATAELHDRIRERLRKAVHVFEVDGGSEDQILAALKATSDDPPADCRLLRSALVNIDEAAVSTIHGFCRRILQQGAFESGVPFDLELQADVSLLVREVVEDYMVNAFHDADPRLVSMLDNELGREKLLVLAQEALRHSSYQIVPETLDPKACDEAIIAASRLYDETRDIWQSEKDAIKEQLEPEIFLKDFRESLVQGLLDWLDGYLSHDEPPAFIVLKHADKLCQRDLADPDAKVCKKAVFKKDAFPKHPFFESWQKLLGALEAIKLVGCNKFLTDFVSYVRDELPKRMRAGQVQSFDDLLQSLDHGLQGKGGDALAGFIRDRYPAALIDEFQDTDPVQYRIFDTVYGKRDDTALFLIGDPKQAIYGFRGADIYSYLRAAADVGESRHTMTTNWRSDPASISSVNALFVDNARPFYEKRIGYPQVQARPGAVNLWQGGETGKAPLHFLYCPAEPGERRIPNTRLANDIPRLVAADIVRLLTSDARLAGRPVRPQDIAVLVRTNKQAAEIQEALGNLDVSAVSHSRESVFASDEAYELLRLLQAVGEPSDDRALRAGITTDLYGVTAEGLIALDAEDSRWQSVLEQFDRWRRMWLAKGFMPTARTISEERRFAERLLPYDNGERRLTNIRHLFELLHAEERSKYHKPSSLLAWLEKQRDQALRGEFSPSEEAELRLESDADAVQLVTIHKSKGLEYPIVYCPYLWQAKNSANTRQIFTSFHDPQEKWTGKIALLADAATQSFQNAERFAEELRLLYVALTRAKQCCFLLWAATKTYHHSALAYLLHADLISAADLNGADKWFAPLTNLSEAELLSELKKRAGAVPGWLIRNLDPKETMVPLEQAGGEEQEIRCRMPRHPVPSGFTVGSFSKITAKRKLVSFQPEAARDHDELAGVMESAVKSGEEIPLALFPKGATAGNFFHRIFELCDFQEADRRGLDGVVEQQMSNFGFSREHWQKPVTRAIKDVFKTRLSAAPSFCLADISKNNRLNELPFIFPVAYGEGATASVHPEQFVDVFRKFPQNMPTEYLDRLTVLDFPPLKGYLKGFIDLVFAYDNKWYLVDYKSNHLGDRFEDYGLEALAEVMGYHHYYLQYHIYTVALHRYLFRRLRDYSYDNHFGGVFYLFIKGMNPAVGSEYGIYFDRPPRERIELFSDLLASPVQKESQ